MTTVKWLANSRELRLQNFTQTALFVPVGEGVNAVAVVTGQGPVAELLKTVLSLLASRRLSAEGRECKYVCPRAEEDALIAEIQKSGFTAKGRAFAAKEQVEIWVRSVDQAIKIKVESIAAPSVQVEAKKLRVLVVDDSTTIRKILRKTLSEIPGVAEVEDVGDPETVPNVIAKFRPDLMTLDINMPGMNGDVLLKKLGGTSFSVPTLVLTSLNINESRSVMDCLEMGAFDYLHKPESGAMGGFKDELAQRIDLIRSRRGPTKRSSLTETKDRPKMRNLGYDSGKLLVIGASTGGTEAIKNVLIHMPAHISPTLIVQHIPPHFSKAFADRLNDLCEFEVKEAEDGDELVQGRVLVAPGDYQIKVCRQGTKWFVQTNKDPLMSGHRPSVDYMFSSVADVKHPDVVAVLLTGMGKDGAMGMKKLRDLGFPTIAQDEESSVVYGMPKAAVMNGGAGKVMGLDMIPDELMSELSKQRRKTA